MLTALTVGVMLLCSSPKMTAQNHIWALPETQVKFIGEEVLFLPSESLAEDSEDQSFSLSHSQRTLRTNNFQ
jgi:hypothetical protein